MSSNGKGDKIMKKKIMCMLLISLLSLSLYGCSNDDEKTSDIRKQSEAVDEEDSTNIEIDEEPIRSESGSTTSEAIPDPEEVFSENSHVAILVYNEPHTYYQVTDYQDEEYENYVDACKDAGFTDIQYEGGTDGNDMFLAYDEKHEFYLEVGITPDTGIIGISCNLADDE